MLWHPESTKNAIAISKTGSFAAAFDAGSFGTGIYLSFDYTVSWEKSSAPDLIWIGIACSASGNHVYAVTCEQNSPAQLFVSRDFGKTWNKVEFTHTESSFKAIVSSESGAIVTIFGGSTIYSSKDFGKTWTSYESPYDLTHFSTNAAVDKSGLKLLALGQSRIGEKFGGTLYTSVDQGMTLNVVYQFPQLHMHFNNVASDASGTRLIATAGYPMTGIYISGDSGKTWGLSWVTGELSAAQWGNVASSDTGQYLVVSDEKNRGCVWVSNNYGESWKKTPVCKGVHNLAISGDVLYDPDSVTPSLPAYRCEVAAAEEKKVKGTAKTMIEHVIVLMMENRSFDHMLGYLKRLNGDIDGCLPEDARCSNPADPADPASPKTTVSDDAVYVQASPDHSIHGTTLEIFGSQDSTGPASMQGFISAYTHSTGDAAV
eukprot:gene34974-42353_t